MTNVNELRQRIAEIEVPKSFLKSLKRNYGYKPIRKTSIGNLPNAEPGAFERRFRNFNVYEKPWGKTDRRRRLIKTDDGPLDPNDILIDDNELERLAVHPELDTPKWPAGDYPEGLKNTSGPTFGLDLYADPYYEEGEFTDTPWDASREKDINLTTGERTAILKQRLARIYEP